MLFFFFILAVECFLVDKSLEDQILKSKSECNLANFNMESSVSVSTAGLVTVAFEVCRPGCLLVTAVLVRIVILVGPSGSQ